MRARAAAVTSIVVTCAWMCGCTSSGGNPSATPLTSPEATSLAPLAAVTPSDAAASQSAAAAICQRGAPADDTDAASYAVPVSQLTAMHGGPPPGIYPYASLLSDFSPFAVAGWCEVKGATGYFASVVSPSGLLLNQIIRYGPSSTVFAIRSSGPYAQP